MSATFTVSIVDDDSGVLRAMARLIRSAGYACRAFSSPLEFLEQYDASGPGCVILDVAMEELDGLQLHAALRARGVEHAVIFVTGRGDIPMSVQAMKAGAIDFLTKPVDAKALLAAIERAEGEDAKKQQIHDARASIEANLAKLTPREREVLTHVIAGRLNKQIASDLGTVEKTIKVHRGRMMGKMGVHSVAELVRIAERVGVAPHPSNGNPGDSTRDVAPSVNSTAGPFGRIITE
jgi:FixJ family two-component response regulator